MRRQPILPRLLTVEAAANYCSLSRGAFLSCCSVKPMKLGNDSRLLRYDRKALDDWINSLTNGDSVSKDWLSEMDAIYDGRKAQRY